MAASCGASSDHPRGPAFTAALYVTSYICLFAALSLKLVAELRTADSRRDRLITFTLPALLLLPLVSGLVRAVSALQTLLEQQ